MAPLKPREIELVARFPHIDWDEPQPVTILDEERPFDPGEGASPGFRYVLTCRFCTTMHGLKPADVPGRAFATEAEFEEHIRSVHRQAS